MADIIATVDNLQTFGTPYTVQGLCLTKDILGYNEAICDNILEIKTLTRFNNDVFIDRFPFNDTYRGEVVNLKITNESSYTNNQLLRLINLNIISTLHLTSVQSYGPVTPCSNSIVESRYVYGLFIGIEGKLDNEEYSQNANSFKPGTQISVLNYSGEISNARIDLNGFYITLYVTPKNLNTTGSVRELGTVKIIYKNLMLTKSDGTTINAGSFILEINITQAP